MLLAVDDQGYAAGQDYDDKMVFRPARLGVYYVVFALDFAGEDVIVDITHASYVFCTEYDGGS